MMSNRTPLHLPSEVRWLRSAALALLGAAVLGGLLFVVLRSVTESRSEWWALREMKVEDRRVLFDENWAAFKQLCDAHVPPALAHRCEEQAELLRQFPECESACQSATLRWSSTPTR
jgi:hypothetical protein